MVNRAWPEWWSWEIEISPHAFKRMIDRNFNEVDLRAMLDEAKGWREDKDVEGRFVIEARHDRRDWEVIVEPLDSERLLLVITAFSVS